MERYAILENIIEIKKGDFDSFEPGFTFFPIKSKKTGNYYNEDQFFKEMETFDNLNDGLKRLESLKADVIDYGHYYQVTEYALVLERWDEEFEEWDWDMESLRFPEKEAGNE